MRNMETIGNQFDWTRSTMTITHCFCRTSCFFPKTPCFPVFFPSLPGSAARPERLCAAAAPVRGVLRGVAAAADAAQGGADGGQSRTARWDEKFPELPGKHRKNDRKLPCYEWVNMGKSTISIGPFSIANCQFTRGYGILIWPMRFLGVPNLQNGVEGGCRDMMVDDYECLGGPKSAILRHAHGKMMMWGYNYH